MLSATPFVAACVAASATLAFAAYVLLGRRRMGASPVSLNVHSNVLECIGNTPMIELRSLSEATGCRILGKCEFLNPGGSTKDRAARQIVMDALASGALAPGGTVYEGTSGSTGISLALVARCLGLQCCIYMPDDASMEKSDLLRALGARVHRVPVVSIADPEHYIKQAQRAAAANPGGFFADQFDNPSNRLAHALTTGPEIWSQCQGRCDAVVLGSGTGGTMAGIASYMHTAHAAARVRIVLADPQGSALAYAVLRGVCFSEQQREGARSRNQVDSIVEGIGVTWITGNMREALAEGHVSGAFRVSDQEVVSMSRHLMQHEGLLLGSSSAVNCVAAVQTARQLGPGHTIVTILCDSGQRQLSKLWSDAYLLSRGLDPSLAWRMGS